MTTPAVTEARTALKNGYEIAGFEVVDETPDGETFLRHTHPQVHDVLLRISAEDAQEYAVFRSVEHSFRNEPVPCSLVSVNYREQLVQSLDPTIQDIDMREFVFTRQGSDDDPGTYVELDTVSPIFINYFRFDSRYLQLCLDRLFVIPHFKRRASFNNPIDLRDILARPLSLRVHNMQASSVERAIDESNALLEGCLFTLAYEWDLPAWLENDWPISRIERQQRRRQRLEERQNSRGDLRLPDVSFNSDLVRLYQAGISSPIATHQFLAFYQILAYFFHDVTSTHLFDRLTRLINDPRFRTSPQHLRRIINEVEEYRAEVDAVYMLEAVLHKYVGGDEIDRFVKRYEADQGEGVYTRRRSVFGESIPSVKGEDQTISSIARRLNAVYDAIVHASDGSHHVPFTSSSETIIRETPLIKFLAESVIIASAQP